MTLDDNSAIDGTGPEDGELYAGLRRSVAGATLTTSAADVVALGRRTRNRHRAVAAGVGTGMAAVVAAIGVLVPGSGAGDRTGAATPPPTSPTAPRVQAPRVQALSVQDAGFTLEARTDGTVTMAIMDAFDPVKLQAALDKAGVPAAVQRVSVSADEGGFSGCAPTPGVGSDHKATRVVIQSNTRQKEGVTITIRGDEMPAGDVLSLVRIDYVRPGSAKPERSLGMLDVLTGRPGKCVPTKS
ncbi:hypothetical protein [Catenulispora subtropica]|uniref:Uncharacterized protein n=1 Tax=Catenulispora subtropica TaxID=450798 RepID=A0ABN2RVZ7_9ACTN